MTNMVTTFITALHLAALSQLESGDKDAAIGKDGEVTRYQVLPSEARRELRDNILLRGVAFAPHWELNPKIARIIAAGIWEKRVATFRVVYRRSPTLPELYLCWHRPGRVLNPRPKELERAQRFENLVLDLENEK